MMYSVAQQLACSYLLQSTAHSPWALANTALPFLQLLPHATCNSGLPFQVQLQPPTGQYQHLRSFSVETDSRTPVNLLRKSDVQWATSGRASYPSCLLIQKRSLFSFTVPKAKKFNQRRLVGWTPEQLYAVVSDVEQYHKFVPWCQKSIVKKRIPDQGYMEAELEVGFQVLVERYVSKVTLVENRLVQSKVADSMLFHHLDSTWAMEPGPSPSTCWLSFSVDFAFNSALYDNLAEVFFSEVVRRMGSAFEGRCHTLYGPSSLHRFPAATASKPSQARAHAPVSCSHQSHQQLAQQHHKHITHTQHAQAHKSHTTIHRPQNCHTTDGHAAERHDETGQCSKQSTGRQSQSLTTATSS